MEKLIYIVEFDGRGADADLEAAEENIAAGKFKGRTLEQKLLGQFKYELDQCKELQDQYKIVDHHYACQQIIVEIKFDHVGGNGDGIQLLQRLIQYGFDRYGWGGTFQIKGIK